MSFPPKLQTFVKARAAKAGISVSLYVQSLVNYDRAKNILADALTVNLAA